MRRATVAFMSPENLFRILFFGHRAMVTASAGLALLFFQCKIRGLTQKCTKGPKCSYLSKQMWYICDATIAYIHSTSLFLSLQILGETFHKCLFIHSKNLFENLRKHIPLQSTKVILDIFSNSISAQTSFRMKMGLCKCNCYQSKHRKAILDFS